MDEFLRAFEERRKARLEADRSFTLCGETLTHRAAVAPEVGMRLESMRQRVRHQLETLRKQAEEAQKANGDADLAALADALDNLDVTDEEMLSVADDTVRQCLEPDSHPAWDRLRSPDAPQPLTFDEIFEVADYLLGRVAGIPTSAPADSSAGRTETAKPATGKSSSRAKTRTLSH